MGGGENICATTTVMAMNYVMAGQRNETTMGVVYRLTQATYVPPTRNDQMTAG